MDQRIKNIFLASGCFVIAEVAQAHDGSLGNAHAYIDAVAKAGADAIKFQTHIADAESTPDEPWRVKFSHQDKTRYDYWKRMEFTKDQWQGLYDHAMEKGLIFLSSPFSFEAIEMLNQIGIPAWKVPSGEITNLPLIEYMAQTGKPVFLSSGMSSWNDLDAAVEILQCHKVPFAIFQCTTSYPCPPEKIGLNILEQIRSRYGCPVGLSDHSGTIYAGLAAATLGAGMIEVHVVFSKECFGPDTPSSLTLPELRQLTDGVRFIGKTIAHPTDKDALANEFSEMRYIFGKSLVIAHDLDAGHRLEKRDILLKKPGTGIPAAYLNEYLGRVLRCPVSKGVFLKKEDVE